jgi:hypothetical protein
MSAQPTVFLITAMFLLGPGASTGSSPDPDLDQDAQRNANHHADPNAHQNADGNADLALLARAITDTGHHVEIHGWDDPTVAWTHAQLAVIRSPWNYPERLPEFRNWISRCADLWVPLANLARMIQWNLDKRYLLDLQAEGVAVVPTTYVAPGEAFEPPATGEFVVIGVTI